MDASVLPVVFAGVDWQSRAKLGLDLQSPMTRRSSSRTVTGGLP